MNGGGSGGGNSSNAGSHTVSDDSNRLSSTALRQSSQPGSPANAATAASSPGERHGADIVVDIAGLGGHPVRYVEVGREQSLNSYGFGFGTTTAGIKVVTACESAYRSAHRNVLEDTVCGSRHPLSRGVLSRWWQAARFLRVLTRARH